jgi:hypothetical protein
MFKNPIEGGSLPDLSFDLKPVHLPAAALPPLDLVREDLPITTIEEAASNPPLVAGDNRNTPCSQTDKPAEEVTPTVPTDTPAETATKNDGPSDEPEVLPAGGSDKPPDPPSDDAAPVTGGPEEPEENGEDSFTFGIQQFDGYEPIDEELMPAGDLLEAGVVAAFAKHESYIDEDMIDGSPFASLHLEVTTPQGEAELQLTSGGSILATFRDNDNSESTHTYLLDIMGAVTRDDRDLALILGGQPRDGEIPVSEMLQRGADIAEGENFNRELEKNLGLNELPVGLAEVGYVVGLAALAEPVTVPFNKLHLLAQTRVEVASSTEVAEAAAEFANTETERAATARTVGVADALEAGGEFASIVQKFLESRGLDPSQPQIVEIDLANKYDETMHIETGQTIDDSGSPLPFTQIFTNIQVDRLTLEEIFGEKAAEFPDFRTGTLHVSLGYKVLGGLLVCSVEEKLTDQNEREVHTNPPNDYRADKLEARSIRNFLRKPHIW